MSIVEYIEEEQCLYEKKTQFIYIDRNRSRMMYDERYQHMN